MVSKILLPQSSQVSIGASWSTVFSVKSHSEKAAGSVRATDRGRMPSLTLCVYPDTPRALI